ncbi:MAG: hypothetical protein RLZZ450_345 [Pseudomonadota bacterium]|jgi:choline dehydrogenase-like flavoprotein
MAPVIWHKSEPWDVVVIGSGATGGWAAYELGRHGLKVLVLEAGADEMDAPSPGSASELDLKRTFDRLTRRRRVQSRHAAYWELDPDLFVVDREHPYETTEGKDFQWIRTRSLNGRLLTWGGIGVRTSDYEFRAPEQDGFGTPWPFGYAELAPHYDRIDAFLPVYGEHDGLPQLPDGKYTAAPRLTDAELHFRKGLNKALKRRAVIAARGVLVRPRSRPLGEAPPPSPVRAAVARFGVSVRTDSVVSHLLVDADGKANGVAFIDRITKQVHEVRARSIAVCASALESARILLHSRSRHHPTGLGNSSGVLGRYLMDHPAIHLAGFAPGVRDNLWSDGLGGPKNLMIPRFHNLENRSGGAFLRGFGMFGTIGRTQGSKAECDADEVPLSIVAYGEMLPRHDNYVTLHPERCDAWGIPILRIDCAFSDNERAMQKHMVDTLTELVEVAGGRVEEPADYFAPGGFVHEMGTARMGDDPKTSVLNGYAQSWDVPNVFVMDGAAWPSGAWQNPTFTMMAIAGRACAHLVEELKQGRL